MPRHQSHTRTTSARPWPGTAPRSPACTPPRGLCPACPAPLSARRLSACVARCLGPGGPPCSCVWGEWTDEMMWGVVKEGRVVLPLFGGGLCGLQRLFGLVSAILVDKLSSDAPRAGHSRVANICVTSSTKNRKRARLSNLYPTYFHIYTKTQPPPRGRRRIRTVGPPRRGAARRRKCRTCAPSRAARHCPR